MKLDKERFIKVIDATPLVAIDLIIEDENKKILLGKRMNKPAQGYWFVPGGRIRKNETIEFAFKRILTDELSVQCDFSTARLHGAYDHIYDDNFAGLESINTHYVVIAYRLNLDRNTHFHFDQQHSDMAWFSVDELLSSKEVHENTKNYFR